MSRERHPLPWLVVSVAAVGVALTIGGLATWAPLGRTLVIEEFPTALALVMTGAWFVVSALTTIPKPYHGALLLVGSVMALPFMLGFLGAAAVSESFPLIGVALSAFSVGGVLLMRAAKISTDKANRGPWITEAWPGIVLVIVSVALIAVVSTRTVPRINHIPPWMLPAERGP